MAVTVTDPQWLALLAGKEAVELTDPSGRVIGDLIPRLFVPPPGFVPPLSEEEMAERRKNSTGGWPLADVIRHLESLG